MKFGIQRKIELVLVGFAALFGVIVLFSFSTVQNHIVKKSVDVDIRRAQHVLLGQIQKKSATLSSQAVLIADLPTLKAALLLSHPDPQTVRQRVSSYARDLKASSFIVTDDLGSLIADQGSAWQGLVDAKSVKGIRQATQGEIWSGVLIRKGQLLFGVSVPIKVADYVKGSLSFYSPIDDVTATELAEDLGLQVAFAHAQKILASSLGKSYRVLPSEGRGATFLGGPDGKSSFVGNQSQFPGTEASDAVDLITLRDYDELVAPFQELQRDLTLVLIGIVVLGILMSRQISRRMLARIQSLVSAATAVKNGETPPPISIVGKDEISLLQSTFNEMADSVQRYQAQLVDRSEDLRQALHRAETATTARTEFLATISHEIRTPLNGILGIGDLLRDSNLNVEQSENLETILSSSESLLTVINDVLDYSELESGRANLNLDGVDLVVEVRNVFESLKLAAGQKNLGYRTSFEGFDGEAVITDRNKVRQVIENLLSNAIKFTESGEIVLGMRSLDSRVEIWVTDTGAGIKDSDRELICEPFSQVDSSRVRKSGGTGLGLSICHHIASLLGGSITLESEIGKGSTFTFAFPLRSLSKSTHALNLKPLSKLELAVLVVDDNQVNLKVAQRILTKLGATVTTAQSGQEAIQLFTPEFELVLMDCHMPDLDGFQTTRALRAMESVGGTRTKIVALTASNLEEDRTSSLSCGMDGFLVKPLRPQSILDLWQSMDLSGPQELQAA